MHPTQLDAGERRAHVVDALWEYNSGIITHNPAGAAVKLEKLTTSPFVFFRGTADLMYRDLRGTDADMAIVLCMGDVHLENFGVMEADGGTLLWGLNDFDEAAFAPFSWDAKRGATSIVLAAGERAFNGKTCRQMAGYLGAIQKCVDGDTEAEAHFTRKRGPKLIRKLIAKAADVDPEEWLMKGYLDSRTGQFADSDEIAPLPDRVPDFQKSLDAYLPTVCEKSKNLPTKITVLDVATKTGSGTGSIGLWRYYALVEVESRRDSQKMLLELKQERCSVLQPYVGNSPLLFSSEGSRVAFAEEIDLPRANPFYGYTSIDGTSYLVRERSPHKARVKLVKLTKPKKFQKYAEACGAALAYAHARSDQALGLGEPVAERQILQSVNERTFASDIGHFAVRMAEQVDRDWKSFLCTHAAGELNPG